MIIEGEFQVSATLQHTWDFLMDIRKVMACIPSCQKVEVFNENNFAITILQKVGPISATFETQTTFHEVTPLTSITATGKGKDTLMGSSFEFVNHVDLLPISERETLVKYKADVKISGRLAAVGQGLIKMVVKKEVDKTLRMIQAKIGGAAECGALNS